MLPLTEKMPKCLLPFSNKTILNYQIDLIKENGIKEIIIVHGFAAEKVEKAGGSTIKYVYNPAYMTTNSIYSFYLVKNFLDSDFILFNSDIIISRNLFKTLLNEKHPNAILVDFGKKLVNGEMNVQVDNNFVMNIGKNIPADIADGESVQVCKFNNSSAKKIKRELTKLINNDHTDKFPAFAYNPVIESEHLKAVPTYDQTWFEIDEPEDYRKACEALDNMGLLA